MTATNARSIHDRVTLPLIREHTKTVDVPHVTDNQMLHYLDTAVELAEAHTGLVLRGQRFVEQVAKAKPPRFRATHIHYKLRHPTSDGVVYYRTANGHTGVVRVEPGHRKVSIPAFALAMYGQNLATSCCNPCNVSDGGEVYVTLSYNAGYACAGDIPAGIVLGILKFIAWSYEHAGDNLITQANTTSERDSGIVGSNDGLKFSGALELFRAYRLEGF
jgi:hypothetical protein